MLKIKTYKPSSIFRSLSKKGFKVLIGNENLLPSAPQFMVGIKNGFLAREEPLAELPARFNVMERILQEMPIHKTGGSNGLLHYARLGETVERDLPLYDVENIEESAL